MRKHIATAVLWSLALIMATSGVSSATGPDSAQIPRIFANARFVYVAAYDGDQFDRNLLPDDREAIARVQEAVQKWGKLTVVYKPQDADVILLVQSRPSEDVLALYDAHRGDEASRPSSAYLWRVMGRSGLQKGEAPFLTQFENAWDKMLK